MVTPGGDGCKISANNATLVLHSAARAFLGDFLCDTLLVHPTVDLCPCDLARIFALEEEGLSFGRDEAEDLRF